MGLEIFSSFTFNGTDVTFFTGIMLVIEKRGFLKNLGRFWLTSTELQGDF